MKKSTVSVKKKSAGKSTLATAATAMTAEQVKQRAAVRTMFNSIAPKYDFINHLLSFRMDTLWRRRAIKALKPNTHSLILDLATGTGDLALAALQQGAGRVIGVDPAFAMLSSGTEKFSDYPGQYATIEGFGEFLPLQSETFTHAMISYGIRNVSNRPATFREFYRVLQPGGLLAILEFSRPHNRLFAACYNFYFHRVLPRVAGWISGNREAYEYLPKTVAGFIEPQQLVQEAQDGGFALEVVQPMFFGVTTLYLFRKS